METTCEGETTRGERGQKKGYHSKREKLHLIYQQKKSNKKSQIKLMLPNPLYTSGTSHWYTILHSPTNVNSN